MPKHILQSLTVLVAAVILLLAVLTGVKTGKTQAQSRLVLQNAQALVKGLKYFYGDQERFPSVPEFQTNINLMLNYFSGFPPNNLVSGQCGSSFSYRRPAPAAFKLNFCLSSAVGGFNKGWNQADQTSVF